MAASTPAAMGTPSALSHQAGVLAAGQWVNLRVCTVRTSEPNKHNPRTVVSIVAWWACLVLEEANISCLCVSRLCVSRVPSLAPLSLVSRLVSPGQVCGAPLRTCWHKRKRERERVRARAGGGGWTGARRDAAARLHCARRHNIMGSTPCPFFSFLVPACQLLAQEPPGLRSSAGTAGTHSCTVGLSARRATRCSFPARSGLCHVGILPLLSFIPSSPLYFFVALLRQRLRLLPRLFAATHRGRPAAAEEGCATQSRSVRFKCRAEGKK